MDAVARKAASCEPAFLGLSLCAVVSTAKIGLGAAIMLVAGLATGDMGWLKLAGFFAVLGALNIGLRLLFSSARGGACTVKERSDAV